MKKNFIKIGNRIINLESIVMINLIMKYSNCIEIALITGNIIVLDHFDSREELMNTFTVIQGLMRDSGYSVLSVEKKIEENRIFSSTVPTIGIPVV